MKLKDLCDPCLGGLYDFNKYDDYGGVISPELCPQPKEEIRVITSLPVHKIKQIDNMDERIKDTFSTLNKLYCKE